MTKSWPRRNRLTRLVGSQENVTPFFNLLSMYIESYNEHMPVVSLFNAGLFKNGLLFSQCVAAFYTGYQDIKQM
jgi:hypothetical protein